MCLNQKHRSKRTSSITLCALGAILFAALMLAGCQATSDEPETTPASSETPATSSISVGRMVFCRAVKDREPQEAAEAFPVDIGRVYCFTEILNAGTEETYVIHRWYLGDKLMAEVKLKAQGEYWRTWSYKSVTPEWKGGWRVDVVSAAGEVLKSGSFTLGEAEPSEAPGTESGGQDTQPGESSSGDVSDGGGGAAGSGSGAGAVEGAGE